MGVVVKFDEEEHLATLRRKLLNGLLEACDLLFRPYDSFNGRTVVRLVDRALRVIECQRVAVLLTAVVIDEQIRRHSEQECARVTEDFAGPVLQHPYKRVLHEILGRVDATQAPGEEQLQIRPVIADQCRQVVLCQFRHAVDSRCLGVRMGMFIFQTHSALAICLGMEIVGSFVL